MWINHVAVVGTEPLLAASTQLSGLRVARAAVRLRHSTDNIPSRESMVTLLQPWKLGKALGPIAAAFQLDMRT